MQMMNLMCNIRFVSGTLEGLNTVTNIPYPLSCIERVTRETQEFVDTQRVIKGIGGSEYVIESFKFVNLRR